MKRTLLLSLFLLAISNTTFSQINPEVLTFANERYYFQNKIYKDKELSPVLEVNPNAHEVYKEYLKGRRMDAALGIFSIAGVGVGGVLLTKDPCRNADIPEECDLIISLEQVVGAVVILGSLIVGVASLPKRNGKNKKLRESVRIFNEGLPPPVGVSPVELNLKTTNHGIGLVLNF